MGLKYLLDSNILSEPIKKMPDMNVIQKLKEYAGQYCTCVTVWHELHYGVQRLPGSSKKTKIAAYLESLEHGGLPILPYEKPASIWLAEQRSKLAKRGRALPLADGEIAAVAFTNQLAVVTRNVQDFEVHHGLDIENWFQAGCA